MTRARRVSGWRKISHATWGAPNDPQIYGELEIDARPLLDHAAAVERATGVRPTITHLVARGVAHALAANPDLNARLRLGRVVERDSVDVFIIASIDDGEELSGVLVRDADRKDPAAIATEVRSRAAKMREGEDELGEAKALLERLPRPVLRLLMRLLTVLAIDMNRDLPALKLQRQTYGSAMISSVGMFGITKGYAPLSPFYKVPFLVLVGQVEDRPAVHDGVVVARPQLTVTATLDHRYLDGFHAARLARSLRAYCANPAVHDKQLSA